MNGNIYIAKYQSDIIHDNEMTCECVVFLQKEYILMHDSRGTKVEKMLTLAPKRYTAGFRMVAKVILWCI